MIGEIGIAIFPYYDISQNKNLYKKRPVLIIGNQRNGDYTVLPISTISRPANIDAVYDIRIEPQQYPKLNLKAVSYVRVHKQTIVHRGSLVKTVSNMRDEYDVLYLEILEKLEDFNNLIMDNALI